jgi:cell division topological specificity factor
MSVLSFLMGEKKKTAEGKTAGVAKERLQIILAHERVGRGNAFEPSDMPALQRDLIEVIRRYVKVDLGDINVHLERQGNLEVLQVKIELPDVE